MASKLGQKYCFLWRLGPWGISVELKGKVSHVTI